MKRTLSGLLFLLFFGAACGTMRPAVLNRAYSDDLEEARKLVSTGHLKQAIDDLSLLIDMDPKNYEARLLRGVAYQGLEEFELAIKDYEGVVTQRPDNAKAHYNLGMIFTYKIRDPRHALEHFDRFLSVAPTEERAFKVAKIMCSIDASRRDSSLEDQGLSDLLHEAVESRDPGERRKKLLEAGKLNPGSPVPLYTLGKMSEEEGKYDDAIRAYRDAIEIRPTCAPCHQSLGKLLMIKKKNREGEVHLLKARLFDPNNSENSPQPLPDI